MRPNRALAAGAYLVAALLVFVPLSEAATSVWPMRFGQAAWRFGAAGLFSRALMTPLLGLLLAMGIAWYLEQGRLLKVFGVLSGITCALLVGVLGLFALDTLEMRNQVTEQATLAFDVASVTAVVKMILAAVTTAALAAGGWKAGKTRRRSVQPRKPGVVAREPERPVRPATPDASQDATPAST